MNEQCVDWCVAEVQNYRKAETAKDVIQNLQRRKDWDSLDARIRMALINKSMTDKIEVSERKEEQEKARKD